MTEILVSVKLCHDNSHSIRNQDYICDGKYYHYPFADVMERRSLTELEVDYTPLMAAGCLPL